MRGYQGTQKILLEYPDDIITFYEDEIMRNNKLVPSCNIGNIRGRSIPNYQERALKTIDVAANGDDMQIKTVLGAYKDRQSEYGRILSSFIRECKYKLLVKKAESLFIVMSDIINAKNT